MVACQKAVSSILIGVSRFPARRHIGALGVTLTTEEIALLDARPSFRPCIQTGFLKDADTKLAEVPRGCLTTGFAFAGINGSLREREIRDDRAKSPSCARRQCMRAILASQFMYNIVEVESDSRFRDTRDLGYFSF